MPPASQPTPPHLPLWNVLPPERLATFLDAAPTGSPEEALALYLWDAENAAAFMRDLAILEISLRESLHRAATEAWGTHWFRLIPLDDRSEKALARAWAYLPAHLREDPLGDDVPGRLVANCTFGFWTNLLDKGGHRGTGPRRERVDYDENWRALRRAFPDGRNEAARQRTLHPDRANEINFSRAWVHSVCKRVNDIRNRVAHHEPTINGFPIEGQGARLTITEAREEILVLARMIDSAFGEWLDNSSQVSEPPGNGLPV